VKTAVTRRGIRKKEVIAEEIVMRAWSNSVAAAGALVLGMLISSLPVEAAAATATSSPPTIVTSNFVCSHATCAIGPGNTGIAFAAGLVGSGGPAYNGPECNPYIMKVTTGTLPPGLQLGEPICEWEIFGAPTTPGTYDFTVQIAPQPNNLGQTVGPDGHRQFSVTVGTGASDRLFLSGAVWVRKFRSLQLEGFDVINSATYTVSVTSTGAKLGTITERDPSSGGDGTLLATFAANTAPSSLTVTDSVGSSVTIAVTINNHY
jgi:hypothetical protein